jgi:hypothetical protein
MKLKLKKGTTYLGWVHWFQYGVTGAPSVNIETRKEYTIQHYKTIEGSNLYGKCTAQQHSQYPLTDNLTLTDGIITITGNTPLSLAYQTRIHSREKFFEDFLTKFDVEEHLKVVHKVYLTTPEYTWWGLKRQNPHPYWHDPGYGMEATMVYPDTTEEKYPYHQFGKCEEW